AAPVSSRFSDTIVLLPAPAATAKKDTVCAGAVAITGQADPTHTGILRVAIERRFPRTRPPRSTGAIITPARASRIGIVSAAAPIGQLAHPEMLVRHIRRDPLALFSTGIIAAGGG